jgi:hypothetical protein
VSSNPGIDAATANLELHFLEWKEVASGFQSLQMALALRKIQAGTEAYK